MKNSNPLSSWRTGDATRAITEFVEAVVGMDVPVDERIAVFDADGTLWCEQPLPVEADFLLRRLAEQAAADPDLQGRQPWKAAHDHDTTWFGQVITEHYAGDDTKTKVLLDGIVGTYAGLDVEDFEDRAADFLAAAQHPSLGRGYLHTAYEPMVELLAHLEANGFSNFMVSGSGADFMRPVSTRMFGIPPDRIIGSTTVLEYDSREAGGAIIRKAALGFLDDGAQKPIQIWSRLGRRPLLACGNSNGDLPMLEFTGHPGMPSLRMLLDHDDAEREFAYRSGAEKALAEAASQAWTVVSMKNDFATVFDTDRGSGR